MGNIFIWIKDNWFKKFFLAIIIGLFAGWLAGMSGLLILDTTTFPLGWTKVPQGLIYGLITAPYFIWLNGRKSLLGHVLQFFFWVITSGASFFFAVSIFMSFLDVRNYDLFGGQGSSFILGLIAASIISGAILAVSYYFIFTKVRYYQLAILVVMSPILISLFWIDVLMMFTFFIIWPAGMTLLFAIFMRQGQQRCL